jgi:hypothetical protein
MLRTTNAAGRIRDESLMNLGGRDQNKWRDDQSEVMHLKEMSKLNQRRLAFVKERENHHHSFFIFYFILCQNVN